MEDVAEVERRVAKNPKSARITDYDRLAKFYWEKYLATAQIREQTKPIRKAGYYAWCAAEIGATEIRDLELYLKILRAEKKSANPSYNNGKNLSYVTRAWLKAAGLEEIEVISEKKGDMAIESGTVGVGEPGQVVWPTENVMMETERTMKQAMENGKAVFVGAGGDGNMGAVIRYVKGTEPVLKASEYKQVIGATGVYVLQTTSGRVYMADMYDIEEGKQGVELHVEPGNYKVTVYMIEKPRFFGFMAVMCKTNDEAINPGAEVEALG